MPLLAGNNGDSDGFFTGYFEIVLNGSRRREGPYQTPIYRRPPDSKAFSRAEIETGALARKGLELLWVDDPMGAYFLAVQGSGVVRLNGGGIVRLGYDGGNGQPYVAIGRLLVERGEIALKDLTMATLRGWIAGHGAAGSLMRENPSYVFFKIPGDGPYGSENVVLTADRSLAGVDHLPSRLACRYGSMRRNVSCRERSGAWLSRRIPAARSRGRCAATSTGAAASGPARKRVQ